MTPTPGHPAPPSPWNYAEAGTTSPLAPHHTSQGRKGRDVELRIVFATEPGQEAEVRARINKALESGALTGPDGTITSWSLLGTSADVLSGAELEHAKRMAAG
jgi:hypothetical protein